MKSLLLMRSAKSSWKDHSLSDIERPLNKRGRLVSIFLGVLLKEHELVPQLILSSSALRARQTAEFLTGGSGYNGYIQYFSSLYMAEPAAYLGALSATPDEIERVMIVGHNPGIEGLMQMLTRRIEALPASSVVYISIPVRSWKDLTFDVECELIEWFEFTEEDEEKAREKGKGKAKGEKKSEKKAGDKEEKKGDGKAGKKNKK